MDHLLYFGSYVLLGIGAGTLSGLLGVGGGVIVVPGFIYLFQQQGIPSSILMHVAAGTSLSAMIVTTAASVYGHYRKGVHFGKILYYMVPGLILGTIAGVILGDFLHSEVLKKLFGILLLVQSFQLFFAPSGSAAGKNVTVGVVTITAGACAIGIVSGLLGVGGGVLMVPFLLYCGIGMRQAVAISALCGFVVAIIGTILFIFIGLSEVHLPHSLGYIYWPACIGVSIGSPFFAVLGATLHHYLPITLLKRIFAVVLIVVAIQLVF